MKLLAAILGCCIVVQPASAQSRQAAEAIAEQRLPISRSADGTVSGAGWDQILADAGDAQFVMMGEQHATADIARVGLELHRALAPLGYTHSVVEVGPHSTRFTEALIRSGKGQVASYLRQPGHHLVIPFLFFAEETDLAEQMVALSPDRSAALWGVDQEFVGSGPIVISLLEKAARTAEQEKAVAAFAAAAAQDFMLVGKLGDAELVPLETAFVGNAEAMEIMEALRVTSRIYAPFVRREGSVYAANLEREQYMKSNLLAHFAEAERRNGRAPKLFLKFGGSHAMRGHSVTNVPALGNFVAEWGHSRGYRLLNIMVDCAGGEMRDPQSGKAVPCEAYVGKDSVLSQLVGEAKVSLFDLRPLRDQLNRLEGLDAKSRQTILAFDYYLAIKDVQAATPVAAPEIGV